MSWQNNFTPWGQQPQQMPYILMPAPQSPVQYGGNRPRKPKKLKPKQLAETIKEYKDTVAELEKLLKKEDKKSGPDMVKVMILLVALIPIIGPLYVMWIKTIF